MAITTNDLKNGMSLNLPEGLYQVVEFQHVKPGKGGAFFLGQDFQFEEACAACHLNYEGSPWKGAKAPYTPFTPTVDPKYTFNFDKMVKDVKAMHEHYKLDGTFVGEPKFKYHDEFQASAKEKTKDKKDKGKE